MNDELIGELLQGLTDDITSIKKTLAAQPGPVDYRPSLEKLATAVGELHAQTKAVKPPVAAPAPAVNAQALEQQLRRAVAEEVRRNNPDYRVSKGVLVGMLALLVSFGLNGLMGWFLLDAQQARDRYRGGDWLYRGLRQVNPSQAASLQQTYQHDASAFQVRVGELERADSIALQAAAFSQQARVLEAQAKAAKSGKHSK
ncbi:hypothetical protein E4631_23005 [Hymenobacter sp. UV11]|uniref:hypothetical protein n=1 Tax=Hymenobacter sp. UV11 TaxID=1849735 RepID=UPI001062011D|nr:hypothetical protein [Hymenobacter sp. UV11]TDN39613.1 hypothetical protein A8B98_18170 [Hymenobacter sp. UV11]TFZ63362.1 hypothetical protein E4631_23005 [Hymenobacter sp. UV11]